MRTLIPWTPLWVWWPEEATTTDIDASPARRRGRAGRLTAIGPGRLSV
ncbi:hypothetical protein [Streptomyces prasinus]